MSRYGRQPCYNLGRSCWVCTITVIDLHLGYTLETSASGTRPPTISLCSLARLYLLLAGAFLRRDEFFMATTLTPCAKDGSIIRCWSDKIVHGCCATIAKARTRWYSSHKGPTNGKLKLSCACDAVHDHCAVLQLGCRGLFILGHVNECSKGRRFPRHATFTAGASAS